MILAFHLYSADVSTVRRYTAGWAGRQQKTQNRDTD